MTSTDDEAGNTAVPEYAKGGLVKGPDGGDSVPVFIDTRCERIFTGEEVRRFTAAKPGSRDALS